ncbi:MAG: hypothetical protein KDH96_03165 [Candidatus Riesia sp.]|nr:hypothetical protein [Candidatus Riesia sp.]
MSFTIVSGLWDLGRKDLSNGFERNFDHYLNNFSKLLSLDVNLYLFIPKELEDFVWSKRKTNNTVVKILEIEDILNNYFKEHYDKVNKIRTTPEWFLQTGEEGWLKYSPQAALPNYNPVVMSKMFMLNDVSIYNPFDSDYFYWIDGGITNTVGLDLLENMYALDNLDSIWLSYPYESNDEIHGFTRKGMNEYCNVEFVNYVVRGGFFGGDRNTINQINGIYYSYLVRTLDSGYLGTEESIFTIIAHNYPDLMKVYAMTDGWCGHFFMNIEKMIVKNIALYVISYNTPKQFEYLLETLENYDKNFLIKTDKYLLNNSDDNSTTEEYQEICSKYNFEHIKKNNLGITGGREFISEHFLKSGHEMMVFFEDDMTLYKGEDFCRSGFIRKIFNLFNKSVSIIRKEQLDFLKLSYSEHFFNNDTQVSWYNVGNEYRLKRWGELKTPPPTDIKYIGNHEAISYAIGDIFFCNWPHFITREGSEKIFSTKRYLWPSEDKVMSHVQFLHDNDEIKAAILLASPIQHERKFHYVYENRKEY